MPTFLHLPFDPRLLLDSSPAGLLRSHHLLLASFETLREVIPDLPHCLISDQLDVVVDELVDHSAAAATAVAQPRFEFKFPPHFKFPYYFNGFMDWIVVG